MEDSILQRYINIPTDSVQVFDKNEDYFAHLLADFDPISLMEMDSVQLMTRIDTKFIIPLSMLPCILEKVKNEYRVLQIDRKRIMPYSSVYFDTQDARMYTLHHNGKLNRYKVRMRSYMTSGMSFLEIKDKNNKGVTTKNRIDISTAHFNNMKFSSEQKHFIDESTIYCADSFVPKLQNYFQRITLVDKSQSERVTLDLGLTFRLVSTQETAIYDQLVIVEMKQGALTKSFFRTCLDELKIRPGSMSKYCLGMSLVDHSVKSNRFKNKIRNINKIVSRNYASTI